MTDMVCENCRFFDELPDPDGTGRTGHCKRRSPLVTGGMMSDVQTVWPTMGVADWCGEHEALGTDPNARLRDEIAGQALVGIAGPSGDGFSLSPDDSAMWAYQYADAMLRAREVKS